MSGERPERDFRNSPLFGDPGIDFCENRENMPWPEPGETLLSAPIGQEATISSRSWSRGDPRRFALFATDYVEAARELVRAWVKHEATAEMLLYPVAYLYRHAIELGLKAAIARSSQYAAQSPSEQDTSLRGHSLSRLWETLQPSIADFIGEQDICAFEKQLLELHRLDTGSDGFRYPFGFKAKEGRVNLLQGLTGKSFENAAWVLDGLYSWIASLENLEYDYRQYVLRMERDAGLS